MYKAVLPYPDMSPFLVHIYGPIGLRWYALSYIAGLLLGWWWILRTLRQSDLWMNPPFRGKPPATADDIGDFVVWATLGVILGGRVGWILFYGVFLCSVSPEHVGFCRSLPAEFTDHPLSLIAMWRGGMSFHGGLAGVAIALWLFCRKRGLDTFRVGDLVASAAPIGLFFGRLANFVNGELWGKPTDVPWAMVFCTHNIRLSNDGDCPAGLIPRHPSQLYEAALEGLVLFAVLQIVLRVFRLHERPGLIAATFLAGYGLFRIFVEFFREPDSPFIGWFSMGMLLSTLMWLAAGLLFYFALGRPKSS